jgi:hypothetical protein
MMTKEFGATAEQICVEHYVRKQYNRDKDIFNKYVEKGLLVEEDAITLFNEVDWPINQKLYSKNDKRLFDTDLTGEPDLYVGETISSAIEIIDVKSSFDIYTYFASKRSKVNQDYYWQLQGYMALTGATKSRLVYCLVNTPMTMVEDEKRRLAWKMGLIDSDNSPLYQAACESIEHNAYFDDIPQTDRVHQIVIERNDSDIQRLRDRISEARTWMDKNLFV